MRTAHGSRGAGHMPTMNDNEPKQSPLYRVVILDNFHFMDESEEYELEPLDTLEGRGG